MPDLLGATNPVQGYERNTQVTPTSVSQNNDQIRNVPDPTRVNRADNRSEQQDNGAQNSADLVRYDSNYQTFLQRLRDAPDLTQALARLLGGREGTVVLSGMSQGIAGELSQALQMIQMDPSQLLQFLSGQFKSGTRFQGALFALLRNAYSGADSDNLRMDILQFLKSYVDHSSSAHIEGNLLRGLERMARAMPDSWAGQLRELMAQLKNGIDGGDRQGNIALLQRSIIPLMSRYVDSTHDMGLPRELLSQLVLDLARYKSGSTESLLQAFHQLSGYASLRGQLGNIDDESLLMILNNSQFSAASPANQFSDSLAAAADRALRGEGSAETQQIFQQLVNALLINESVYMPVNHYLVPLSMDGRMLFSELWVDPDDQEGGRGSSSRSRAVKVLFKMDVQSLGLFDIVLTVRDKEADLRVSCPESASSFSREIQDAMAQILTRNGLTASNVVVRRMERPVTLTEVFPKIFEGKNCVNVKV
jgi:hypothetical protein